MSACLLRLSRFVLAFAACGMVAACGSTAGGPGRVATALTPYKVPIVQGNFVSREQVEALKAGMSREQVRDVLGTPLVASLFHADRWDYVFALKRQGVQPQTRRLTLYFKGNGLERFEGDAMPSESEFVATLDVKRKSTARPMLEASEESLRKAGSGPRAASAPAAELPPLPASYPPLEPPGR